MSKYYITIIASLMFTPLCLAQNQKIDENIEETIVTDFIHTLDSYFSHIKDLSFTVKKTIEVAEGQPIKDDLKGTGVVTYLQSGDKYQIDDKSGIGSNGRKNNSLIAFDGETYQRLHYDRSFLYTQKLFSTDAKPNEFFLRYTNPLLMPFEFLSTQLVESDSNDFTLKELQNPINLHKLSARMTQVKIDPTNRNLAMIDIASGVELVTQKPTFYRVFWDREKKYPVKWERIATEGNKLYAYQVNELAQVTGGDGINMLIPLSATKSFFGGTQGAPVQKTPYSIVKYSIEHFKFNEDFDLDTMGIDPSLASTIYNANADVTIEVPR